MNTNATNKKNLLNAPVIYCKICYTLCNCIKEHNIHIASPDHITNKNNFINTINYLTDTKLNEKYETNNIETIIKMNEMAQGLQIDYDIDLCKKKGFLVYFDPDLYNHKYDIEFLEKYVNYFNEKTLLQTQTLTAKFCIIYIMDMDIDNGSEDSYLFDMPYILSYQTHITKEEMYEAYNKYFKYNVFELYREKMNEKSK
jgi:hypothetical protein